VKIAFTILVVLLVVLVVVFAVLSCISYSEGLALLEESSSVGSLSVKVELWFKSIMCVFKFAVFMLVVLVLICALVVVLAEDNLYV